MNNLEKKVVYVDMDFTLCDFGASYLQYKQQHPEEAFPHSVPGFFIGLAPMLGAIETFQWLNEKQDIDLYILTTPSIRNPHSYTEKRLWVEKHLGINAAYKLIISPNKGLNKGHYLIDDYTEGKGQENFEGKILQFGSEEFPDWRSIKSFFELEY
jgi:5'-nucleotidase